MGSFSEKYLLIHDSGGCAQHPAGTQDVLAVGPSEIWHESGLCRPQVNPGKVLGQKGSCWAEVGAHGCGEALVPAQYDFFGTPTRKRRISRQKRSGKTQRGIRGIYISTYYLPIIFLYLVTPITVPIRRPKSWTEAGPSTKIWWRSISKIRRKTTTFTRGACGARMRWLISFLGGIHIICINIYTIISFRLGTYHTRPAYVYLPYQEVVQKQIDEADKGYLGSYIYIYIYLYISSYQPKGIKPVRRPRRPQGRLWPHQGRSPAARRS